MKGFIYKIIDKYHTNNFIYIGSTCYLNNRITTHKALKKIQYENVNMQLYKK